MFDSIEYKIIMTILMVTAGLVNARIAKKEKNYHSMWGWITASLLALMYYW
jgi:uncharacterized membrane protein